MKIILQHSYFGSQRVFENKKELIAEAERKREATGEGDNPNYLTIYEIIREYFGDYHRIK